MKKSASSSKPTKSKKVSKVGTKIQKLRTVAVAKSAPIHAVSKELPSVEEDEREDLPIASGDNLGIKEQDAEEKRLSESEHETILPPSEKASSPTEKSLPTTKFLIHKETITKQHEH